MLSFGEKIIGARSILGWSQSELAETADLGIATVQSVEAGKACNVRTEDKLVRALSRAGIEFTEDGIRKPDNTITRFEGDDWFSELLEDAYFTLLEAKNKEMLIFGGNNKVSPPSVIAGFRRLRQAGVRIREMVEEGDDYLMGPEADYRWIPSAFYKNYVTVVYAHKVLNDFGTHGLLFTNTEWADAERNKFDLLWSLSPELTIRSAADVRY
ncbi:MAG: hypothetical protein VYB05_11995 [Pseudomonadota bacterium]|nr:hypothetical protein [Pseudomonadota bacterium]